MINIRAEKTGDKHAIRQVLLDAFPTPAEANLVEALREQADGCISLVAEEASQIIGHIMFSPVTLKEQAVDFQMVGLAPMAVLTAYQNKGIGSQLVKEGLAVCLAQGYELVVVLGHPEYYPRFGFEPSTRLGLKSEYEVPAEVFMARMLTNRNAEDLAGTIVYHECFQSLS